jgi:CheY-like chemotaxis protein
MPVMDGIEATQVLKASESTKHIPVIALTASAKQDELKLAKELFDGYLSKPVNVDELFLCVNQFIKPKDNEEKTEEKVLDVDLGLSEVNKEKLYANILPRLKSEVGAVDISEIQNIAEEMIKLGEELGEEYLKIYGNKLQTAASVFNIEGINILIAKFIDKLEDK